MQASAELQLQALVSTTHCLGAAPDKVVDLEMHVDTLKSVKAMVDGARTSGLPFVQACLAPEAEAVHRKIPFGSEAEAGSGGGSSQQPELFSNCTADVAGATVRDGNTHHCHHHCCNQVCPCRFPGKHSEVGFWNLGWGWGVGGWGGAVAVGPGR